VAAMELAFLKFGESKRKGAPPPQAPNAQEMADASLPGERTGESRRSVPQNQQDVESAWKNYQKSGSKADAEAFARARLKDVIKEDFLRQ